MPKLLHVTIEFKTIAQHFKLEPLYLTYAISFFVRKNLLRNAHSLTAMATPLISTITSNKPTITCLGS